MRYNNKYKSIFKSRKSDGTNENAGMMAEKIFNDNSKKEP
jgi:hypothetical protein